MQNSIIVYCRDVEGKHGYNFSEVPWQLDGKGHFRLDGLKKYCKYGLVVQAFNGRGSGPMSPEVVAQTLEDGKLPFFFSRVTRITLKLQEEIVQLSTSLFSLKHKICS